MFALVFTAINCGSRPDAVAKVGTEVITMDEFKDVLKEQYRGQSYDKISMENKKKTLDELIDGRLKILKARELNLDEDPALQADLKKKRDNLMAQAFYQAKVVDPLVTEKLMRIYYKLNQSEIEAVVIALGFNGSKLVRADRSRDTAMLFAQDIVKKIKEGEDPGQLSAKYSDDQRIKKQNGLFDPYTPAMFDPAVDKEIANAHENELLGPIDTDRGIFIVKVFDMKNSLKPASQFDKDDLRMKKQLYQKFFNDEGTQRYKDLTEQFKKEVGMQIDKDNIAKFFEELKTWAGGQNPRDGQITDSQRSIVLGKIGDKNFTAGDFIDLFNGRFYQYYPRYQNVKQIENTVDGQLTYLVWVKKARQAGYEDDPDIVAQINREKRLKLIQLLEQDYVKQQATFTEEEVQAAYEADKEKYNDPEKIEMWEIVVKDKNEADRIYDRLVQRRADFETLAKEHSIKPSKNRGGRLGFQTSRSSRGEIVAKAFEAGPDQILKPFKAGEEYYIIKTGKYQPERQKPLKEVRNLVENGVRQVKEHAIRQQMMDNLHKEYSYWINEPMLRSIS
jgi:parvulin-like peptidyl-prolyl isomerase